jgi:DNA mismatch repair protein MutS2
MTCPVGACAGMLTGVRRRQDPPSPGEPVLDLHGLRVSEALRRTNTFLVRERADGTISVRIVTGHGTGAVKQAIRALLNSHPAVASIRPALATDAVTLVLLKPPPSRA